MESDILKYSVTLNVARSAEWQLSVCEISALLDVLQKWLVLVL